VYLTDKPRHGNVKSFIDLTDAELDEVHRVNEQAIRHILARHPLDVLHANHLVYQPVAALRPCREAGVPLIVYPHGSAIEYVVKHDARYRSRALDALLGCAGWISGSREVRDRILALYPEHADRLAAKCRIVGVGVDTRLFQPVARAGRAEAIRRLQATEGRGGKPPALVRELHAQLARGDRDAVRAYRDRYDQRLPDDDLNEHLARIPWDGKILLFVGALTVGKGLQSLITALPAILERHPDAHLVIVGSGTYREVLEALVYGLARGDLPLLGHLCSKGQDLDANALTGPWEDVEAFTEDAGRLERLRAGAGRLLDHVHFLGRLDHDRLRYLFPCADLAVFPSVIPEAYPLVVFESLANGVLPVVSDFSGLRECIDAIEPDLGAVWTDRMRIPVEPEDRIRRLAAQCDALLADPARPALSPALRRLAEERFDWSVRAEQMAEAYARLIRGSDARAR
jgi:glycosyltransferase involved in cell wall biosynthesis